MKHLTRVSCPAPAQTGQKAFNPLAFLLAKDFLTKGSRNTRA